MPARPYRYLPRFSPGAELHRPAASRLAAGQMALHDLRARSSIIALEGALQLVFRDHSLAWLGSDAPLTSLTLHEGERFVTSQRGVVSIRATPANRVAFMVLPARTERSAPGFILQTVRRLAGAVRTRWRRAA
ncbi:hypothetical protein BJG93_05195 [Paraburkholderia sprentiae WSM5005]|uniref:AraC family transcriptional regulator n=1 Tax=Paraburkholderia sprentiae WSM5005 TaxID=754502 RepID=A0A1I9YEV8_9BURK|nr:hypothetical protein [Paraburkholderia sprentiae]APA84841.1 hypothetical protein BJG93_05195 [Paraburkholderia sprentiae WSM5005]